MQQNLSQIASYLPYKLKLLWVNSHNDSGETLVSEMTINKLEYVLRGYNKHATVKLILKSMNDLTNKELDSAMWKIGHRSHIDWTTTEREYWIEKCGRDGWIKDIPYAIMTYLFENHYDVFGLIEQGLAVDAKTLK